MYESFLSLELGLPPNYESNPSRSLVIDHLQSTINRDSEYVAYFYCARNTAEPERGNPEEILRSILRQLSCPDPVFPIHELVQKAYVDMQDQGFGPRKLALDETSKLIIDVINAYSSVTIIVDALDECNTDTRSKFLLALKDISAKSATPVKILVSSRDDGDLLSQLNDSPQVRIREEDNAVDIERFINHQVEECIRKKEILMGGDVSEELRQLLIDKLIGGAKGMWVATRSLMELPHIAKLCVLGSVGLISNFKTSAVGE